MMQLDSPQTIDRFIGENKIALLYMGANNCGVCVALLPKIEELLKKYSKIACAKIEVDKLPEVAGQYSVFTVPAIIIFIEGKEVIREARFISIPDLEQKIKRFYDLV